MKEILEEIYTRNDFDFLVNGIGKQNPQGPRNHNKSC